MERAVATTSAEVAVQRIISTHRIMKDSSQVVRQIRGSLVDSHTISESGIEHSR